jgi:uncharacterized protein YjbI with pentapeptide repeats
VLAKVRLIKAQLGGADLSGADLRNANLRHAALNHAYFSGAILDGAILGEANLSGADLSMARGLNQELLNEAWGDESTKLPRGLTIRMWPSKYRLSQGSRRVAKKPKKT